MGFKGMSDNDYDDDERELRELEAVEASIRQNIDEVNPAYTHAINTLWAGNGTGCLAVLGAISTLSKCGTFNKLALLPLLCFLAGLICMCLGSALTLWRAKADIEGKQRARSRWDFPISTARAPSERAELALTHPRTLWALFASGCFIAGCLIGFMLLWFV